MATECCRVRTQTDATKALASGGATGQDVAIKTIVVPLEKLRPEVLAKVGKLGPAALQAVHRFLLQMEFRALTEEIQDDFEKLRVEGKLEPELIDEAIREYRQRSSSH